MARPIKIKLGSCCLHNNGISNMAAGARYHVRFLIIQESKAFRVKRRAENPCKNKKNEHWHRPVSK